MKSTAFVLAAASLLGTFDAARAADASTPFHQATAVEPTIKAINYEQLGGTTKIGMRGTVLLPDGEGKVAVKSLPGAVRIKARFKRLEPPSKFDPNALTYVLWAISPEGRAVNLGELVRKDATGALTATTDLQTFGLIVTAEPYFGVTQPGDVVVLENSIPETSKVKVEPVAVRYEFHKRGPYTAGAAAADLKPVPMDPKVPFELYQARNAVKIAKAEGADSYAPEAFKKADQSLQDAERLQTQRRWYGTKKHEVVLASRRAVQGAEDSRLIAMKRKEDERVALQISDAKKLADDAQAAKTAADQAKTQALADAEKARVAAAQADAERQKSENEKAELRAALRNQLNLIFTTRDTARGLIMNMPNALFASGKHELNASAREQLAKIAGVVLTHPGLKLTIEGHTDGVGSDEYNQRLSEMRANAVKDYMAQAGVPADVLRAEGYGKTKPIATNDTPEGRRMNRRVDIVVSGDVIGTQVGASTSPVVPSGMKP